MRIVAAAAKSLQSCPTLCDPIDSSPPGSPVPGILQARTLEWVAISCRKVKSESEVAQSCPTLCDPMDCSPPGSSIHGIFQARLLEWGAIAFSGGQGLGTQFLTIYPQSRPKLSMRSGEELQIMNSFSIFFNYRNMSKAILKLFQMHYRIEQMG